MTGYDEALAWFRADPERMQDLDEVDNRSAVIAIVRALLAAPPTVPAGRDLTANDVRGALGEWNAFLHRDYAEGVAEHLNRIARPSGGVGQPDTTEPRSWSLPAPPPDDVTVVYVDAAPNHLLYRADGSGTVWESKRLGKFFRWSQMLSEGTVVEGEPPASEPPFAVGDRVRVKSTGRTGVLREIDSRGRHLIFGDNESWITGVRADNLEPAPEPRGYRKGFDDGVKYARDIDRTIARMTVPAAPVDEAHRYAEGYDPHETGSLLVDIRAAWLAGHRAALAAADAERVEEER